ncbi:MAG: FAD:protein FMN transferase [Gammaproteobacteria bacterium]|nr:FAD:protein FMN transferase [Gammaproteobacteria bacterium]
MRLLCCAVILGLSACQRLPSASHSQQDFTAFGSRLEVELYAVAKSQQARIYPELGKDLEYLDFALHPWHAGSLGRTNTLMAAGGDFSSNVSVLPLLAMSKTLSLQSNELFNPAIGQLMALWGYHRDTPPQGPPPEDAKIKTLLALTPSMRDFTIQGVRIHNTNPAIRFDLTAVAKGYTLEKLTEHLRAMGVAHALLHTADNYKALGQAGTVPWTVTLTPPGIKALPLTLELHDNDALATVSNQDRAYDYQGKHYHSVIDPRNGYPADYYTSVSVLHSNATVADAAATAIFIAGPADWPKIAKQMGVEAVLLIDHQAKLQLTRAMYARLTHQKPPATALDIIPLP